MLRVRARQQSGLTARTFVHNVSRQNNLYKKFFPLYGSLKRGCTVKKERYLLYLHKVRISYRRGERLMRRERERES